MVVECVFSVDGNFIEPEIFVSFNHVRGNDRTYLYEEEREAYFSDISGEIVDGRLYCEFSFQIIPTISHKSGRIWDLNQTYYIFGATGSAQPDELNAHDLTVGSFYYPIISKERFSPTLLGEIKSEMPTSKRLSSVSSSLTTSLSRSTLISTSSSSPSPKQSEEISDPTVTSSPTVSSASPPTYHDILVSILFVLTSALTLCAEL